MDNGEKVKMLSFFVLFFLNFMDKLYYELLKNVIFFFFEYIFLWYDEDFEMEGDDRNKDLEKVIFLRNEVEDLCEECRSKVENIMKEEGK